MKKNFSLLIKPVSLDCNLRCTYCFYLPCASFLGTGSHRMSLSMLETIIMRYADVKLSDYHFGWQGGEPTLAGLDFFRHAVELQKKYFSREKKLSNALQTNGTLLNREWADFLASNHFLTGISIDGPAEIHNLNRCDIQGHGSHERVIGGLKALQAAGVEFNVLTLISSSNIRSPELVYNYLCELGIQYHQYIECVETDPAGNLLPYAVTPEAWGEFLCRIFDLWFARDIHRISIRLFDSIISRLATGIPQVCPMNGDCRNYFVIEYDGSVYPCDFFVRPETKLGSIPGDTFKKFLSMEAYSRFGRGKCPSSAGCLSCKWLPLCMGDCQKNRMPGGPSRLCAGWKIFYEHTISRFEMLADSVKQTTK